MYRRGILIRVATLILALFNGIPQGSEPANIPSAFKRSQVKQTYPNLPISFEANQGQTDPGVKFLSRGSGYALFLTPNQAVISLGKASPHESGETVNADSHITEGASAEIVRMRLIGANPNVGIVGLDELSGKVNYFIGSDPANWRTNIRTYARVNYRDIYPGIDLIFYGKREQLEYDFVVSPGADPNSIVFEFGGTDKLEIDAAGDLVLHTPSGPIRQYKPVVYQEIDGHRQSVPGSYLRKGERKIGFQLGDYDPNRVVVIDPSLTYSSYLGSADAAAVAVAPSGDVFLTGSTGSTDFPTANAFQKALGGGSDAFVMKLSPAGDIVYSTYFGGSGNDSATGIAVDSAGNAYVTGFENSPNFPLVNPVFSTSPGYGGPVCNCVRGDFDAFVSKFNPVGSALVYSTYLSGNEVPTPSGGSDDRAFAIAVDSVGNAYVTGQTNSNNFPTRAGTPLARPLQAAKSGFFPDAFITKLNPTGAIVYSTYLGGNSFETGTGIAVDALGNAYVTGNTNSTDFPTRNAFQPALAGPFGSSDGDAFVAKLNPTGSALVYSTYLGGSGGDNARGIAVDPPGNAYVVGTTYSNNFPTANPLQSTRRGNTDVFVSKLNPEGLALVYSTYIGGLGEFGRGGQSASGITIDAAGNAYVTGATTSSDFPTKNALQPNLFAIGLPGDLQSDAFVTKLNSAGSSIVWSTYLGGSDADGGNAIAVDSSGFVYVLGGTRSFNFPLVHPVQSVCHCNAGGMFLAKIDQTGSSQGFTIPDRGGFSLTTGGSGSQTVGYARIQPIAGSSMPNGVAIFRLRQNNVLVTEAGVPASPLVQSGRIYAEVNGPVNTGLAIANPSNQPATVSFYFTDANGDDFGQGSTTVPPNGQIARFLNEVPFNGGSSIIGTFTFTSSLPISAIALRGFTNERSEFLITTLPVADLASSTTQTIVFPHFADGGGWTTQLALINPTDESISGTVQFFDQGSTFAPAQPLILTVNGETNSTFPYSIPSRSSQRLQTSGSPETTRVGSIRVVPSANSGTPSGLGIFSSKSGGVTVAEGGVPALRLGSAFRLYVEAAGNFFSGEAGSIQTGVAIANPSASNVSVNFELTTLTGVSSGLTGTIVVPAQGQVATFLSQIPGFPSFRSPFQGILRISTASLSAISVLGARGRYNERGDFLITTTPPVNEADPVSSAELFFPQLVDGGGYTTQFILFSGSPGRRSSGALRFFSQSGQPLVLSGQQIP